MPTAALPNRATALRHNNWRVDLPGSGPNQFALTSEGAPGVNGTYRLRRCHFKMNLVIPNNAYGGIAPMASSSAVIAESNGGFTLYGWALPSLRSFTIQWPRFHSCGDQVILGALTRRMIYVGAAGRVYSTPIPTARDLAQRHHPRWPWASTVVSIKRHRPSL